MKNILKDQPDAYKRGWVEFYKLKFKVTPDVLIPRPETELLVDEVIAYAKRRISEERSSDEGSRSLTILDLGTGSGNIAISCAKYLPTWNVGIQIIATDVSAKTLKVARQNAKLHGVEDKITFIQSNLLNVIARSDSDEAIPIKSGLPRSARGGPRNDNLIIVTNLPYIPSARIPYLDSSVKDFEPLVALDGGEDGFELYRKLFQQINQLSNPGLDLNLQSGIVGWKPKLIIGEIDYTHGELAVNEAQKYFPDAYIEVKKDLTYLQRILIIKFNAIDSAIPVK